MPIQTSDLMMRLQPLTPIPAMTGGNNDQLEMEKQRLQLMQQEFENTKQQQAQQRELERMAEGGRMAREKMTQDRIAAAEQAKANALLETEKNAQLGKFTELNGKGDIEGARAMVPLLTHMGVDVSLEGEEHGLPRYRIGPDPEAQARASGDIGYPTDDSGTLSAPVGIPSTEDAFKQAQAAMPGLAAADAGKVTSAATGTPVDANQGTLEPGMTGFAEVAAPDQPDYTGAVPKNVIDLGAQQQQTLARLNPALKAFVDSYPPDWQSSAASTAAGVAQLGLPADKALETLVKLRGPADAAIQEQKKAEEQAAEHARAAEQAGGKVALENHNFGYNEMAPKAAANFHVEHVLTNRSIINQAKFTLQNRTDTDDYLSGSAVARLMGDQRVSDDDVKRVLGGKSASFLERLSQGYFHEAVGGLEKPQRDGLIAILNKVEAEDRQRAFDFMGNIDELGSDPSFDKDKAEGMRDYVRANIPRDMRDAYQAQKKPEASAGSAQPAKPFNMIQDAQSQEPREGSGVLATPADWKTEVRRQASAAGYDPDALVGVVQAESGGDPAARNPSGATGLIQFMPNIAKAMGTSTDAIAKMGVAEQVPLVLKYLQDRGVPPKSSQGDMYVAIAAGGDFVGKPDTTVVYPKGSAGWRQNPAWRPSDGGDVTVGSIKAYGGGKQRTASSGSDAIGRLRALRESRAQNG